MSYHNTNYPNNAIYFWLHYCGFVTNYTYFLLLVLFLAHFYGFLFTKSLHYMWRKSTGKLFVVKSWLLN